MTKNLESQLQTAIDLASQLSKGFCATGQGGGIDNSCGREGGGDAKVGAAKDKYVAGEPPAEGMLAPKPPTVKLPKSKARLNIDESNAALKQMGYTVKSKTAPDSSGKWSTTHTLTDAKDASVAMSSKGLKSFIYANQKK
jgi:hypothetical protein